MLALHEQQRTIDFIGVSDWLSSRDLLDTVGGHGVITRLYHSTPSANGIEGHAKRVHDYYMLRKASKILAECQTKVSDPSQDVREVISTIEKMVLGIAEYPNHSKIQSAEEILEDTVQKIRDAYASGGVNILGYSTGCLDLDMIISGSKPKTLAYIGGRPAMGKTSFLLMVALMTAMLSGNPVCFFSLEMSKEELILRAIALLSGVDGNAVRSGRMSPIEMDRVSIAFKRLEEIPIWIDDLPDTTPAKIASKVLEVQNKTGKKVVFVGVDYVQLMLGTEESKKTNNELLGRISHLLSFWQKS